MIVNILWPFVPPAIAVRYTHPGAHEWIFALNYLAIVPSANLLGFAGQELARKLPKVFGDLRLMFSLSWTSANMPQVSFLKFS